MYIYYILYYIYIYYILQFITVPYIIIRSQNIQKGQFATYSQSLNLAKSVDVDAISIQIDIRLQVYDCAVILNLVFAFRSQIAIIYNIVNIYINMCDTVLYRGTQYSYITRTQKFLCTRTLTRYYLIRGTNSYGGATESTETSEFQNEAF